MDFGTTQRSGKALSSILSIWGTFGVDYPPWHGTGGTLEGINFDLPGPPFVEKCGEFSSKENTCFFVVFWIPFGTTLEPLDLENPSKIGPKTKTTTP